jgi:ubiquinone/menaquinone biosynthesis C-methylase UbiE
MSSAQDQPITPERIVQTMWGYAPPMILVAAIRHRVFDALASGPRTVDELATRSGASARGFRALLNALVGLQFLTKENDRYRLTPESAAFLVSTQPGYLGGMIEHTGSDLLPGWLRLHEVVQSGKPAAAVNDEQHGADFFERLVSGLFPLNYPMAKALARNLGLDKAQKPVRLLDLATGSGAWAIGLAQQSPMVHATALDWPGVIDVTRRFVERHGLADRFSYIAGDVGEVDFGSGYDIATLGHILHSEGAARSRSLLKKTFDALAPGGRIAVAEFLVNEDRTGPTMGVVFAVNMLLHTQEGDTFSFEEIRTWLKEAGFQDVERFEPGGPASILLAKKPD